MSAVWSGYKILGRSTRGLPEMKGGDKKRIIHGLECRVFLREFVLPMCDLYDASSWTCGLQSATRSAIFRREGRAPTVIRKENPQILPTSYKPITLFEGSSIASILMCLDKFYHTLLRGLYNISISAHCSARTKLRISSVSTTCQPCRHPLTRQIRKSSSGTIRSVCQSTSSFLTHVSRKATQGPAHA